MSQIDLSAILELLQNRASRPVSLREMQELLDLSAGDRKLLGKFLKGLVKDGTLVQLKGGRFALPKKVNLVVGVIHVHRDGYGFVSPVGSDGNDVFIPARHVRPAMHGDTVVVRLERSLRTGKPEGRVIRVEKRAYHRIVGRYVLVHGIAYVTPIDTSLQDDILIAPGADAGARHDQMVVAEIESYPGRTRGAIGKVCEILGDSTDPDVEIRIAAIRFGLPYEFSAEALQEAASVSNRVEDREFSGREDLRSEMFVTIDGETAKDFDDAVAIERLAKGFRLRVAVADVAHYVAAGGAIDRDALDRGTSVYFPGACLPMLPETLSNGICSLNPHADRLVLVAELDFDLSGHRIASRFFEAVICSQARLTYTEVASALLDNEASEQVRPLLADLQAMRELAELRIDIRHQRGSLDFDLPEAQIKLDLQGKPENIVRAERTIAHRIIEEFMLVANEAVAFWLVSQRAPVVFRVHDAPGEGKMADFQAFIANFNQGISIPAEGVKPKLLQDLLERIAGRPEEQVINHVLLRSLPQAYYATENSGHFGLAADHYCHFTSPIRRYPDLTVHRILKERLPGKRSEKKGSLDLVNIAAQSSQSERRAMEAERDIVKLKKCQYVADKVGEEYHGLVVSVHAFGFFVELQEFFVEGLVHVSTLDDDFYQYEEERHRLIGMNRRREFTIGMVVTVSVHKVDLDRREIDFHLVGSDSPVQRNTSKQATKKQ